MYDPPVPASPDPFETLDRLTRALDRIRARCPAAARQAAKAQRLVARLADDIEESIRLAERRGFAPRRKPKLAKSVTGYGIEESRQGPALAEHRSTGAAPFRCPKYAYDAVVEAIERGPPIQKFEEIRELAAKILREQPPVFWIRVAIRFFVSQGLLQHGRARYERTSNARFRKAAAAAWAELEHAQ